ncbi:contact-dependent growth inhibition system immunity protein [Amycolatopsis sp. NPDC004368]
MRLLLRQDVGVDVLVPEALSELEVDPLVEGDFHPGDLLLAVLALPAERWDGHHAEAERLDRVVVNALC